MLELEVEIPFFLGFYETHITPESDLEEDIDYYLYSSDRYNFYKNDDRIDKLKNFLTPEFKEELQSYPKKERRSEFEGLFCQHLWSYPQTYNGRSFKKRLREISEKVLENFKEMLDWKEYGIVSFEFSDLVSPREYNFSTDRLFAKVIIKDLDVFKSKVQELMLDNKDIITEYLKDRHESRSGFISFYPHEFQTWFNFDLELDHVSLCTYLAIILLGERPYEKTLDQKIEMIESDLHNEVTPL